MKKFVSAAKLNSDEIVEEFISRDESGRHFGRDFELGKMREKCSVIR